MSFGLAADNMLKILAIALNGQSASGAGGEAEANSPEFLTDQALWEEIKKELISQTVLPLASDYLNTLDLADKEKLELMKYDASNVRTFHKLMGASKALFELLGQNDIKAAVMKGAAAAQYYPQPDLRCFGDIDVLVEPANFEKAFYLLKESGYENILELDSHYRRHIGFVSPSGVKLELHRFFSIGNNTEQETLLDSWLYSRFDDLKTVDVLGYQVPVFPDVENGIILLEHIRHHLNSGLGLRQIIDWMMFVRTRLDDSLWNDVFFERAEAVGLGTLAKTVTKMCKKYLGLGPSVTWCDNADDDLADDLMTYIIKKGNFGRKEEKNVRATLTVVHRFGNVKDAFGYLTSAGQVHMAEAGLKPRKSIAWLYQVGHLVKKTLQRRDDAHLVKEIKQGKEETEFLKHLSV